MQQLSSNKRLIGLDIIRAVAIICVIAGHFFSVNTPFNETPFRGVSMLFQGLLKSFFCTTGVPFFILLSGFLCCEKILEKKYYFGLKKVIIPYVIISFITWLVLSGNHSLSRLIMGILGFDLIGYAWYVEMYIGLFLLIPFLNIIIKEVISKEKTLYLIITLLFLTALPPLFNRGSIKLVPGYWMMMFPITYYCIGALVRLEEPHLKRKDLWLLGAFVLYCIAPCSQYVSTRITGTSVSLSASYYSLINTAAVTIVFLLLYDIDYVPICLKEIISFVAIYAFETFLFSYLYDKLVYPFFMERFYETQTRFIVWFVPIVMIVFILSLLSAFICRKMIIMCSDARKSYQNRDSR